MKKEKIELLALISNLQLEILEVRQELATQHDWQINLETKISELTQMISNQQGYLNDQVAENSSSIKTLVSLVSFGAHEIFQYVQLLNEQRKSEAYSVAFAAESPIVNSRERWKHTTTFSFCHWWIRRFHQVV